MTVFCAVMLRLREPVSAPAMPLGCRRVLASSIALTSLETSSLFSASTSWLNRVVGASKCLSAATVIISGLG